MLISVAAGCLLLSSLPRCAGRLEGLSLMWVTRQPIPSMARGPHHGAGHRGQVHDGLRISPV
jgi:hypothetical protein